MIPLKIATCRPLPEPDVDEPLLLDALREAGIDVRMTPWREDIDSVDVTPTIIRSTWDYIHQVDDFVRWAEAASRRASLWNPINIIRRNVHKGYLLELQSRGLPVTPTILAHRGEQRTLAEMVADSCWMDVVIKPAVGAGSFETHRLRADEPSSNELFSKLCAARDVLIQPYLTSVEGHGERALVWIDGEFTHAVRKSPRFSDGTESVSEAMPISSAELALGHAALRDIADQLLYARVDVAPGLDGMPVLMELELIEPSLFLLQNPRALQRLVDGIGRRLRSGAQR
jgi:glutathione synthase/RimK-type ligase-like ATP-grasp enzyme